MATYGRYAEMLEPKSFSHFKITYVFGAGTIELKHTGTIDYNNRIYIEYYTDNGNCRNVWHFLNENGDIKAASLAEMII